MNCTSVTLTSVYGRCQNNVGGIRKIYIALRDDVVSVEQDNEQAEGMITAITMADTKQFIPWEFRPNTGSYSSTTEIDPTIGNSSVTTEVSLQFTKAEATKRLSIQSAINAGAVVIVEDCYGQYIYLGHDSDVYITSATMQSGTARTDLNGFNITFQDISNELPYFVTKEAVEAVI